MCRIVAFFLMPLLVVSNCLAHTHGATALHSTSEIRAHIHLGFGREHNSHKHDRASVSRKFAHKHSDHSHDHDHDHEHQENGCTTLDGKPVQQTPIEHDSDAVYLVGADCVYISVEPSSFELDCVHLVESATSGVAILCEPSCVSTTSCHCVLQRPLYLLHAALRL